MSKKNRNQVSNATTAVPARSKADIQLEITGKEGNLKNADREVELIGNALKEQTELKDMVVRGTEVRKAMHEAALKNYKYVNPTYAFQTDKDYIAAQKEWADIEFKLEVRKYAGQMKQINSNLESYAAQVEDQKKLAEKLRADIAALKAEMGE